MPIILCVSLSADDERIAKRLLESVGYDLSGFGSEDTSPSEVDRNKPVKVTHVPDFIWSTFTKERMHQLHASGQSSAIVLLGKRKGDEVVALTGLLVIPGGEVEVTDEDIIEGVRLGKSICFDSGDYMEVVGALIAQRRSASQVKKLMVREPSLQVVMVGYSTRVERRGSQIIHDVTVAPYAISQDGGIQLMPKIFVDPLQQ